MPKKSEVNMRGLLWVWVNWIAGLIDWGLRFRMGNTSGKISTWFLVFYVRVTGCSRNRSGEHPYLWVQEKFVQFRQSAKSEGLCPADFLGQCFSDSALDLLRNLCDIVLVNSRNGRVPRLAVPRLFFLCFPWNVRQQWLVSRCCYLFEGNNAKQ